MQLMPRKPAPKPKASSDPEEYKRFLETACEIGADETEEGAERAFKKVVGAPKRANRRNQA